MNLTKLAISWMLLIATIAVIPTVIVNADGPDRCTPSATNKCCIPDVSRNPPPSGKCTEATNVVCKEETVCTFASKCTPKTCGCPTPTDKVAGTPCATTKPDTICLKHECDGKGTCKEEKLNEGKSCGPSANKCKQLVCEGGHCKEKNQAAGTSCATATKPDTPCLKHECDASGVCQEVKRNEGHTCDTSTNKCKEFICVLGHCKEKNKAAGTSCETPTKPDTFCLKHECDGSGVCQEVKPKEGKVCDTSTNECKERVCQGGLCKEQNKEPGTHCGSPDTICLKHQCDAGICKEVKPNEGKSCGTTPNNCKELLCEGGQCKEKNKAKGTSCKTPTKPDTFCLKHECDGSGVCEEVKPNEGKSCDTTTNKCKEFVCVVGLCKEKDKAAGTSCGTATPCKDPKCDGHGVCNENKKPAGTSCGVSTDPCKKRVCNLVGECIEDKKPDGTICKNNGKCRAPKICDKGVCVDGNRFQSCGISTAAPCPTSGKVNICHATGSASNPFVLINVNFRACETHLRQHSGPGGSDFVCPNPI